MGGNMKQIIIGIIMIVVSLLMFGIVLDSVQTLLSWTSGGATIADFTGLEQLVTISPLLIFIGLLAGGGWLTFTGFKAGQEGGGRKKGARGLH
jgi:hypothetical protein